MKLLLDQNLSDRLLSSLASLYPGSEHVRHVGLARADDAAVWTYAADRGLTITSKDSDFHQRSLLFGHPPKVIWIQTGNCSTSQIEVLLRRHREDLYAFDRDGTLSFLVLA